MLNFVLTLELKTEKWQEDILDKRFNIGRQIYNACLGELFKKYNTMIQSKEYRKVLKMPKGKVLIYFISFYILICSFLSTHKPMH